MNGSELAMKMLEWERVKRQLDEIEDEIETTVLEIGKTQTVGNVRATYSAGRKTYDYKAIAEAHPMVSESTIGLFSKAIVAVDWRGVCEHIGIEPDDVPFTKSAPGVSVKLLE